MDMGIHSLCANNGKRRSDMPTRKNEPAKKHTEKESVKAEPKTGTGQSKSACKPCAQPQKGTKK